MHDWKLMYRLPHCCNMELLGFKENVFFLTSRLLLLFVSLFFFFFNTKKVKALCESQNCLARPVAFTNKLI